MTMGRWGLGVAAVFTAGFLTLGAGVMAYSVLSGIERNPPGLLDPAKSAARKPREEETAASQVETRVQASPIVGAPNQTKAEEPLVIQVETVDSQGKPLSGVELGLSVSYTLGPGKNNSSIERATSDNQGRGRLQVARNRPGERAVYAFLWAYHPGRALAAIGIPMSEPPPASPVRLTLDDPVKRTITIVSSDDQPVPGLRLVPRALERPGARVPLSIPGEWRERLAVLTDPKGVATIPYLSRGMIPLTVQVSGPRLALHTLDIPAEPGKNPVDRVLKLGRPGRLAGIVRGEDGQPIADVPVEIWVRAAGAKPSGVGMVRARRRLAPTDVVTFDSDSPRTGAPGAFQTPSSLLRGSTYRVSIRHEGFVPFVSDWIELDGDRTTIAPIRLRALRKLVGSVHDRQGQPVAEVQVFLPSGGPTTTTDAQGRFFLAGIDPEKTYVLVKRRGFRFQGWFIDPPLTPGEMRLSLARSSEPPEQVIAPLSDPLPAGELKTLSERLLEPSLESVTARDNDLAKREPLLSVIEFAPDRVRKILDAGQIRNPGVLATLRGELAMQMAAKDPADAEAAVMAIADPRTRMNSLIRLAAAPGASPPARRRKLLEEAIVQSRAIPANPIKIGIFIQLIEGLLDLNLVELAKPLVDEGLKLLDSGPAGRGPLVGGFLIQVARIDPAQALARIQKIQDPAERFRLYGKAAVELAPSQPAEAERFYGLMEERSGYEFFGFTTLLCRQLAKVDPPRAQRIAAAVETPGARACAWAFTALGASERDKPAALESLDRSLEAIDLILDSGPGLEPSTNLDGVDTLYPRNPAAVVLPVVEQVAPERLAEFFWRAVALHEHIDPTQEDRLQRSGIGFECMLLSHYDRQAAATLFEPMNAYIRSVIAEKSRTGELTASVLVAKACIDPKAGVELLELLAADHAQSPADASNEARLFLAKVFAQPPAERWKILWRSMRAQLPLEDE
jgi:hypothetical protein